MLKSLLKRIFKIKNNYTVTDSELLTIVEEAEQEGGIDTNESELLRNVIEFDDITAGDILTPRVDIIAIHIDTDKEKIAQLFKQTGYSRLPVYKDSIDQILGIIHQKNFYSYVWNTKKEIDSIIKPVEFVPPTIKISTLLKRLQKNNLHFAVIVDEFGGTEGILTLEDIIEELIGNIWDEHDEIEAESFKQDSNGNYLIYCTTDLNDLFEFFNLQISTESSSINGWIIENLEKIPVPGDSFEVDGIIFTVRDVANNRAISLLATGSPLPDSFYDDEYD